MVGTAATTRASSSTTTAGAAAPSPSSAAEEEGLSGTLRSARSSTTAPGLMMLPASGIESTLERAIQAGGSLLGPHLSAIELAPPAQHAGGISMASGGRARERETQLELRDLGTGEYRVRQR